MKSNENNRKHRMTWPVLRWLIYLTVGLFNTAFIKAEDLGSWKNYVGYGFLVLALIDGIAIVRSIYQSRQIHKSVDKPNT